MRNLEPVLIGKHVTLRPIQVEDAAALWSIAQHDAIWAYMPSRPFSIDDMTAMIAGFVQSAYLATAIPFAVVENATGAVVGSTQILDIVAAHKGAEIGWTWLTPRVWRSPINTDCKLLLLSHCFETMGLIRVQLKTDLRNERSQAAIARLGAVREGVLRKHRILHDGYIRDSVYFSILDTEWPAVKAGLEARLAT